MNIGGAIKALIQIFLLSLVVAFLAGAAGALLTTWILLFGGIAEASFWVIPKWTATAAFGLCALYCIADEFDTARP